MLKLSIFLDLHVQTLHFSGFGNWITPGYTNNYMGNNSNTVLGAENPALKSYFGGYLFTSPTFARDWFGMGRWALN